MEVHHHPEVEKKGLKEYILEGLMIFLAVTMGFFAEGLRENINDNGKEGEYITSMIRDAKTDIFNFRQAIILNKNRLIALDSVSILCYNYRAGSNDGEIYRLFRQCMGHPDFADITERTLSQLKNAGGMRLIKKKASADSIILYDQFERKLANQQEYYNRSLNGLADVSFRIFNYKYFFVRGEKAKLVTFKGAKLLDHRHATILEMGNRAKLYEGIVAFYINRLTEANQHAVSLINTLRKEYKLDDE
ncbi:MAG: hypothetical protein JWR02_2567 [Mucilaginibacter sp.]|nr:hypothetical protein [Mucilaginibacter sp.]